MNRLCGHFVRSIFTLALGTAVLFMGLNPVAEAASMLTFEQPVHFLASDGTDVMVGIGTYEIETLVGSRLRLNMDGGETVWLDAQATTHSEEIEEPLAITVSGEDPDVVHLVLLLPNGQALDAPGSISGTRSRGFSSLVASRAQIQRTVAKNRPIVRDHRKPNSVAPQPQTPFGQTAPIPMVTRPSVGGPTNNVLALPDRYIAPTPGLTTIANAMKLQSKSLNSVLVVPSGLQLSTLVDISVEYISPASPRETITQSYMAKTGNRFVRQDLEGDGRLRRQLMDITLTERMANGAGAQFTMKWQVDLDPLYDVWIGRLQFKLIDDCDDLKSEIQVWWLLPDGTNGTRSFSARRGQVVGPMDDFHWYGSQLSAKKNLLQPYLLFLEHDPCFTADCVFGTGKTFEPIVEKLPLIPGKSGMVTVLKKAEKQSCRAEFSYPIKHVLYEDPALVKPTP